MPNYGDIREPNFSENLAMTLGDSPLGKLINSAYQNKGQIAGSALGALATGGASVPWQIASQVGGVGVGKMVDNVLHDRPTSENLASTAATAGAIGGLTGAIAPEIKAIIPETPNLPRTPEVQTLIDSLQNPNNLNQLNQLNSGFGGLNSLFDKSKSQKDMIKLWANESPREFANATSEITGKPIIDTNLVNPDGTPISLVHASDKVIKDGNIIPSQNQLGGGLLQEGPAVYTLDKNKSTQQHMYITAFDENGPVIGRHAEFGNDEIPQPNLSSGFGKSDKPLILGKIKESTKTEPTILHPDVKPEELQQVSDIVGLSPEERAEFLKDGSYFWINQSIKRRASNIQDLYGRDKAEEFINSINAKLQNNGGWDSIVSNRTGNSVPGTAAEYLANHFGSITGSNDLSEIYKKMLGDIPASQMFNEPHINLFNSDQWIPSIAKEGQTLNDFSQSGKDAELYIEMLKRLRGN